MTRITRALPNLDRHLRWLIAFPTYAFWLTAPAKLSPDIVGKLNAEVRRIVKLPQVRQRFENDALVTMDVDAPALTTLIAKEVATWGPLAKDLGLRVQ